MTFTFVFFQLLVVLSFLVGSFFSQRVSTPEKTAGRLIAFNLTVLDPPIIVWSIMGLTLDASMAFLPLAGFSLGILGFIIGKLLVSLTHLQGKGARVYVISSALANTGFTMGGFICYLIAGEKGLALSGIFMLFFIPFTFLFIFAYAGMENRRQLLNWASIRNFLFTLRNLPLLAAVTAICLRLTGIERPRIAFPLELFLFFDILIYYLTLGINFKVADLNPFKKEHLLLAVQKFILLPTIAWLILSRLPLANELKQIITIQSFMPVAIYSVISAIIFNLDARRASSMFVINTLIFVVVVFPLLIFFQTRF